MDTMKISMTQVKVFFTAFAATVGAVALAQEQGVLNLVPAKVMHYLTQVAVLFGIFGASPLGRLLFVDAPSNDIVPKDDRLPPGKPELRYVGARAIPEWDASETRYVDGSIVTYQGRKWLARGVPLVGSTPEGSTQWEPLPASDPDATKP